MLAGGAATPKPPPPKAVARMQPERASSSENHTPKPPPPPQSQSQPPPTGAGSQRHPSQSSIQLISKIPKILPLERVFPIQIGSELFKLSGASISSDAPSYFSQYFQCQIKTAEENGEDVSTAIRTLYIDRDPVTFKDISLHLQGYHVQPRDGTHFVRLFADAQFYSLPKLVSQLYEESIFMSIGHREFQIPRDLFHDPGNSPNFFSLGFAIFFSSPEDLFPGLDREGLIRPPSIMPPSVPNRSAETFAELLHLLRGYPVHIRDDAHRQSLLRDCRYFNFKGLEQRLVPHTISFNQARHRQEIALRLEDILKSGISVATEPTVADPSAGWVNYARPFVDDKPAELVLEIGSEATKLHISVPSSSSSASASSPPPGATSSTPYYPPLQLQLRAEFFRDARARVARLFEVIATKLNLPPTTQPLGLLMASGGASSQPATPGNTPLSEDLVRVVLEPETSITLDGRPYTGHFAAAHPQQQTTNTAGGAAAGHVSSGSDADADDLFGPSSSAPSSAGPVDVVGASPASLGGLPPSRKRRRVDSHNSVLGGAATANGAAAAGGEEWVVRTGQWRLRIQGAKNGKSAVECVLVAVKLDAMSSEHARNAQRGFLNG